MLLARKDERLFTGRAVTATVLVCRIRNFAHFVEDLSPEQTLRYLNEFYALAGNAIQRNRGIIETFLGDGVVAVFGVPLENPIQEDDALRAALEIVRNVVAMRERWARQHRKPFTVGIGINTGSMIAGDAGFRDRREFTVVGPEAMLAHRLQEAAFALNAFIVASRRDVRAGHARNTSSSRSAASRWPACAGCSTRSSSAAAAAAPSASPSRSTRWSRPRSRRALPPPRARRRRRRPPRSRAGPTAADRGGTVTVASTTAAAPRRRPRPNRRWPGAAAPARGRCRARPQLARAAPRLALPQHDDDESILPDPPPRRATYEDRTGPPLDLY